ncbi:right-handed parallel beta-helix repeat-containing protein [Paenibacillus sp. TRM 82003]|nr:right-handed parallel beta-helix repeat-containing protein [Paenibacillus sp. TRM 82003]
MRGWKRSAKAALAGLLALQAAAFAVAPAAFAAEQVTEYPVVQAAANAVAEQANPDRHLTKAHSGGSDGAYNIKVNDTGARTGFFRFEVNAGNVPADATRVYLSLKGKSNGGQGTVTLNVYGLMDDGWQVDDAMHGQTVTGDTYLLTWNRAPAIDDASAMFLGTMTTREGADSESLIDATAFLAAHGGDGAVSFAVVGTTDSNVQVYNSYKTGTFTNGTGGKESRAPGLKPQKVEIVEFVVNPYDIPALNVTSSADDGNIAPNTVDNNRYTRWSAQNTDEMDQYITFDLGASLPIGYLGIAFYNGDTRKSLFDLLASSDGATWTTVATGLESSGATASIEPFDLHGKTLTARYLRYVGHGNSSDNVNSRAWNSITEFQAYPPHPDGATPVIDAPYKEPELPPADPYTKPGLTNPDGTPYAAHTPNPVTGATLSVVDFGADPANDETDDTPAVLAAIDAAKAGDEVYFPNGTYNLISTMPGDSQSHFQLKNGVNLRGESQAGAILLSYLNEPGNSRVIKAFNKNNVRISNLTITARFDGAYTTDTSTKNPDIGGVGNGIYIDQSADKGSYNITIDAVTFEYFQRMGIRIAKSRDITVRNSVFRNATDVGGGGAGYGISVQGTPKVPTLGLDTDTFHVLVENNRFEGPYLRHGVVVQYYAHNNLVKGNTFLNNQLDAIDLHGEDEYLNEIAYNHVEGVPRGGIGVGNTGGTPPLTNHDASGPGNWIHHNTVVNTRDGILVYLGSPNTIIEANTIRDTTSVEGAAGIRVLNGPGTVIKDNVITNNTASGFWGIVLAHDPGDVNAGTFAGKGDPSNVTITGNTVTGNANGLKIEAGTGIKVTGNNISGNLGTNVRVDVPLDTHDLDLAGDDGDNDGDNDGDGDGGGGSSSGPVAASNDVETTTGTDGRKTVTVAVRQPAATDGRNEVKVEESGEAVVVGLSASLVKEALGLAEEATFAIRTPLASVELPAALLLAVLENLEGDSVTVRIAAADEATAAGVTSAAAASGVELVGGALDFELFVGETPIDDFGGTYVTRTVVADGVLDAAASTVLRYDPESGTLSFVPAVFAPGEDGKTTVAFMRTGNSVYAVAAGKRSFDDIAGHPAQASIEALASKRMVSGVSSAAFEPDREMTRAELAALLLRSLGLEGEGDKLGEGGGGFPDVPADAWYASAVRQASELGFALGHEDGAFRPNAPATHEQMGLMLGRALAWMGSVNEPAPAAAPERVTVTRAEAVVALRALLVGEGLMNE